MKQCEQSSRLIRREILRDRMQHDEIERVPRQPLDFVRLDHTELWIIGKSRGDTGAYARRTLTEQNLARGRRDNIGMERFARTVIEHMRGRGGYVARDVLRDLAIIDIFVARIDVPI